MKIAMLVDSHYPNKDGVVDAIDLLRGELAKRGHQVLLIAPDPGKGKRMDGVHYIPAMRVDAIGYFLPIFPSDSIFEIKDADVDVINIQGFGFMAVRGIATGKLLKKPVVLSFHTPVWDFVADYSPLPADISVNFTWTYFRRLFKWADLSVAQTPSIAKELFDNGVKPDDIRIIPTGIDTETFRPGNDGTVIRERHNIVNKKVIIHVGRLSPEKQMDVLLNAFTKMDDDTVLMIVGRGALEKELKDLTASLGLNDKVIFTGFVPDEELPLHYAAADAAVSSSVYEAQCLAIMNAMAAGLPVACTNGRAFVDFIRDGENGYLYEPSPEGCAEAMKKCLSAPDTMRTDARRTAEEYSIPRSVDAYISLYEEAIAKKKR
ncbi:MAG: glycosyltransferase [Methanomassiliicoccaceae archaeon]|nr:glycosyltransferase [Methanomassiliicoccaceae archaeon]